MKRILLLLPIVLIFTSCFDDLDQCENTVTYTKATAIYENLDEVRATPLIGEAQEIENAGKIFVGEDFILIGEEGKGIHVYDNTVKSNPSNGLFLNIPQNREFFVDGTQIIAETQYDVIVIDIKNLSSPSIISRATNVIAEPIVGPEGNHLVGFNYEEITEKLDCDTPITANSVNFFDWRNDLIPPSTVPSSFAGSSAGTVGTINRIATADDHVYIVSRDELYVLSNMGQLEFITKERISGNGTETVYHDDGHLFIGQANGMVIMDISTPVSPRQVKRYNHEESCDPVLPNGDIAYITLRSEGDCPGDIDVLDVVQMGLDNPGARVNAIQQIQMDSPYGMTIANGLLYVGEGRNGLKVFDIEDPRSPQLLMTNRDVQAYDVMLHPTLDILLIAGPDGLQQYETNSSLDLTFLSSVQY